MPFSYTNLKICYISVSLGSICSLFLGGSLLSLTEMVYFLVIPFLINLPFLRKTATTLKRRLTYSHNNTMVNTGNVRRILVGTVGNIPVRTGPKEAYDAWLRKQEEMQYSRDRPNHSVNSSGSSETDGRYVKIVL